MNGWMRVECVVATRTRSLLAEELQKLQLVDSCLDRILLEEERGKEKKKKKKKGKATRTIKR